MIDAETGGRAAMSWPESQTSIFIPLPAGLRVSPGKRMHRSRQLQRWALGNAENSPFFSRHFLLKFDCFSPRAARSLPAPSAHLISRATLNFGDEDNCEVD